MTKQTGLARTIGGTILLVSIVLKQFGIELEISESDTISINEAVGAVILGYGVVVNIFKRIQSLAKGK